MKRKKYYKIDEIRKLDYHKERRDDEVYFVSIKFDFYIDCDSKELYFSDSGNLPTEEELEKGNSKIESVTEKEIDWINYCYNSRKFIDFNDFKEKYKKRKTKLLLL